MACRWLAPHRRSRTVSETPEQTAPEEEAVSTPEEETPDSGNVDEQDVGALRRALEREREERRSAKEELRLLREDDEHLGRWLKDRGFEIQDEPDDDFDDDEPDWPEQPSELEKRLAAIEAERALERFDRDLNKEIGERDLSAQGRDWVTFQTVNGGNNPQALQKAVKAWFEFEDSLRSQGVNQLRQSKKTPRAPTSGKPATEVPDLDDRNSRRAYMLERAQQLNAQQR
jgi:hypothetical protein